MHPFFRVGIATGFISLMLPVALAAQNVFQDPLDVTAPTTIAAAKQMLLDGKRTPGGRLVAVGRRGVIITSDNEGGNWTQSNVPVSTDLVAIDFPTAQQGWAVGHSGVVLHTKDGGLRWERQLDGRAIPNLLIAHYKQEADSGSEGAQRELKEVQRYKQDGPSRPLFGVSFKDPKHGVLVGAYNLALRTEDGGNTWQPISDLIDNPQGLHLYGIAQINDTLWIAGEQGLVLKQDQDTGRFVRVPTDYEGTLFGITGNANEVIVFGLRGNAFRSLDGGTTWTKLDTGTLNNLTSAANLPDGRVVLTTLAGELLVASTGNDKLTPLPVSRPQSFHSVSAASPRLLLLTGANGVQITNLEPVAINTVTTGKGASSEPAGQSNMPYSK